MEVLFRVNGFFGWVRLGACFLAYNFLDNPINLGVMLLCAACNRSAAKAFMNLFSR